MSRHRWGFVLLIVALGCGEGPSTAVRIPAGSSSPSFAKTGDTHSRGNAVWNDVVVVNGASVAAGIRGDGRDRRGQTTGTPNEYQDSFCGVRALLYDQRGESGRLTYDPDTFYDAATMAAACGPVRRMPIYLGDANTISSTPTWAAPNIFFDALWELTAGQ